MAFCRKCGKELREGDVYCPDCGTPAGMMAGPAYAAPRKRGGPLTILLIMAVAFLALTFFLYPTVAPADYEVTITVEEFAVCNTDRTVDNDPADKTAEILFQFKYDGVTKYVPGGETDYFETPVGAPGGESWKTGAGLTKPPEGKRSVTYKAYGSGSIQVSVFMLDYDGTAAGFGNMEVYDTIDIFDAGVPDVDRPGVSGLFFTVDLVPGKHTEILQGDDLPMGYVKLSVDVKKV
ncbi:MAG: zinc-ribbon domain-containing protein [Thermoplasmatales archaeon]|nr:zinc-ribbon domain-containing protein [Thermoplasmatales archaeon]